MPAPVLAVGDGALGFWKALREVFPATREQRCWFHVSSNVLAALPKSAHPGAKAALAQTYNAEDRDHALQAVKAFETDYGTKCPKAVAKITEHIDVLLAFYDYPAEHWIHLRTTNPIVIWSPPSPPSGCGSESPRDRAQEQPASQWRSSSSSPHKPAGAQSTHPTSSLSSVPAPDSRRASSSNDPTNQEVISESRDYSSQWTEHTALRLAPLLTPTPDSPPKKSRAEIPSSSRRGFPRTIGLASTVRQDESGQTEHVGTLVESCRDTENQERVPRGIS
jgi:hypothetical protein